MTADPPMTNTGIDQNYGAVHSGSGPQSNTFVMPDLRRTPWLVDGESEDWLADVFVLPDNWDVALHRLHADRLVVLADPPGTGRQAAARRLLGTVARADDPPIRRPAPPDDTDRLPLTEEVAPAGRLLFDLSDVDIEARAPLLAEIPAVYDVVRRLGAFLVVILPEPGEGSDDDWLRRRAVQLGRPEASALIESHLRVFGMPEALPERPSAEFSALLGREPGELARLTWLVAQTASPDETVPLEQRMLEVATSSAEEAPAVARWVANHTDGHQRALLLAAAMFTGFPAETVHQAQCRLANAVGLPVREAHELAEPDLGARLAEIDAVLDAAGVTTLPRYDTADAIRRHFWVNFPGLRDRFVDWILRCGDPDLLGGRPGQPSRAGDLIGRFVDVCVQVDRVDDILRVARQWATDGPSVNWQVRLAGTLLCDTLARPEHASRAGRQCYEWARTPSTPPGLGRAVVIAAEAEIAPRQPGQAVVRLHHLLRNEHAVVADEAAAAMSRLAAGDPLFQRQILARLADPSIGGLDAPGHRAAFRGVANPERLATTPSARPLLDDTAVRRDLVTGWHSVLQHDPPAEQEHALHQWLTSHAEHPEGALIEVLVDACRRDFRLLGTVFGAARRWWSAHPEHRRATLLHVEHRITQSRTAGTDTSPDHSQNGAR